MPIDHKDEYATLRQEMLERFARIHDTAKYGVGGFIAILGFYYAHIGNIDHAFVLLILLALNILIGLSALSHSRAIYSLGTYMAVISEKNSKARWHRMIRHYSDYLKKYGKDIQKEYTWRDKLVVFGRKRGVDPTMVSILTFALPFFGFVAVYLKAKCWNAIVPCDFIHICLFLLICLTTILSLIITCLLWFGMGRFTEKTEDNWKRYYKDFGTEKFPDPYE